MDRQSSWRDPNSVKRGKRVAIGIGIAAVVVAATACSSSGSSGSGGGSSGSGRSVTITYAASNGPTDPNAIAMTTFAAEVKKLTNGTVKVDPRPDGEMGNTQSVAAEVKSGAIQMSLFGSADLAPINGAVGTLSLPFIFANNAAVNKAFAPGGVGDIIAKDLLDQDGMMVLAWQDQGFVQLLTKSPVKTLANMQGLKIRATEDDIEPVIYNAVGAQPTSMDISEVFTGLSTGTIDGIGNPNVSNFSHNFQEVAKNLTIANLWYIPDIVVINAKFFDSLSSSQQQALKTAATQAAAVEVKQDEAAQQQDQNIMVSKYGVHVYTMSQADLNTWKSKLGSLYSKYETEYPSIMQALGFTS